MNMLNRDYTAGVNARKAAMANATSPEHFMLQRKSLEAWELRYRDNKAAGHRQLASKLAHLQSKISRLQKALEKEQERVKVQNQFEIAKRRRRKNSWQAGESFGTDLLSGQQQQDKPVVQQQYWQQKVCITSLSLILCIDSNIHSVPSNHRSYNNSPRERGSTKISGSSR